MKKIKCLLVFMTFLVLSSICVMADGAGQYEIGEIGATVNVPDGYNLVVYTRDSEIAENDNYATDANLFHTEMENNNEYLRAYHPNANFKIHVFSVPSTSKPFNELNSNQINQFVEDGLEGFLDESGIEIVSNLADNYGNTYFAAVKYTEEMNDGRKDESYMYATITNGRIYVFVVNMQSGVNVTDAERTMIKEMATKSKFTQPISSEPETEVQIVGGPAEEETSTTASVSPSNLVENVVNGIKIIALIVVALVAIMFIRTFLIDKKKADIEVPYTTRRSPQYEERLKRIMASEDQTPKPVQEADPMEGKSSEEIEEEL